MSAPITVTIDTLPTPQGSMVRTRYGVRHSKPEALALFRAEVKRDLLLAAEREAVLLPLEGPLVLTATFVLPRPKSAPKRRVWPTVKPDTDKLLRALCDALTDCGAWLDDAQVVRMSVEKRYVGHLPAMPTPGVLLTIRPVLNGENA